MDILIKSFNRPYYLDRCIQSIYTNVRDKNLRIVILDDGTPTKYLEKIQNKFPKIVIIKSEFYEMKSNSLAQNKGIQTTDVPIQLWLQGAQNASDYFLLLEDDIWFTKKIDLEETQNTLKENSIYMLKLFWLNNPQLVYGITKKQTTLFLFINHKFLPNRHFYTDLFLELHVLEFENVWHF